MKRIFAILMVLCMMLCVAACDSETDVTTTTETVTTTLSAADQNRIGFAKLGFEELMNYLNICAAYGVNIEVNADDTIEDVITKIQGMGGDVEARNVLRTMKFFDYAQNNPDVANGTGVYIIREDADWLALYVD